MVFIKKVVNSDAGDADHVGGNDWDALDNYFDDVNITGPAKINTPTHYRDQKLILKNPANTQSLTFVNPAITSSYFAKFIDAFDYLIMKDGSNYVAKRDNWALESSNTAAETVIQYAIDNAGIGGAVGVKGVGSANYFTLTDSISLVDKNVFLTGFNTNGNYNTAVLSKGYATAEPFIDITNSTFTNNGLRNIGVLGNSVAGSTGIKFYLGRGNVLENVNVTAFDTGIEASGWVDCDVYGIRTTANMTYGMHMNNLSTGTSSGGMNTCRFFGGKMTSSPTNLYVASNSGGDLQFFGTEFEGANSGYLHGLQIEAGSNDFSFYGCSFEKNSGTNPVLIYDDGNNNLYFKCRLYSDQDYTPVEFRSNSRNNTIFNCFLQGATSKTGTILIDSGALDCAILHNRKGTNTVGTVTLSDSGTRTTLLGNSSLGTGWNDRLPSGLEFGANGLRLLESSSTILAVRDSADSVYRNITANSVGISQIRTTGQTNLMTLGTALIQNLVATENALEQDVKVISAPSNPASGFVRMYAKAADANNDVLCVKEKINGAIVEVIYS